VVRNLWSDGTGTLLGIRRFVVRRFVVRDLWSDGTGTLLEVVNRPPSNYTAKDRTFYLSERRLVGVSAVRSDSRQ
jgi:hypothetical protein